MRLSSSSDSSAAQNSQPAREESNSFPIVAIGASAGGLDAFTKVLRQLPADTGMAFVLVQHLDPNRPSMLSELLARETRMPVIDVTERLRAQANRVYVMPPGVTMEILGGEFKFTPRRGDAAGRSPIDIFMRSLAEDRQNRAIGVILSGTAHDGTLGAEAIKAEGGIIFAEDPKAAAFDGMPRSAIASGCVDFVLPPEKIARELKRLSRDPYVMHDEEDGSGATKPSVTGKGYERILSLLRRSSGVDFRQYRPNTIHRRTSRRMMVHRIASIHDYANYLGDHPDELDKLYNDILIPVTRFFRDPDAFEVLQKKVYPAILKDKSNHGHIRMWAPGCSTGEETYSLAMSLLEVLGDKDASFQIQAFGTDLSDNGIAKARAGIYSAAIAEDVSPERLRRFFEKIEEGYRVSKAVRDLCVFARQNLADDPPFSQMNLVSCRNLLIYMGTDLQKRVLPILHYALKPSGFLFLGHTESTAFFPHMFAPVDKAEKIFAKRPTAGRVHYDFSTRYRPVETPTLEAMAPRRRNPAVNGLQEEADRIVLKNFVPAGVVINNEMEVLQFRGRTSPYLEPAPGQASLNVLKLARKELSSVLRRLVHSARRRGLPAKKKDVAFRQDGQTYAVDLSVTPVGSGGGEQGSDGPPRHYLVMFEDSRVQIDRRKRKATKTPRQSKDKESVRLRRELAGSQNALRAATESEDAMREEFQSANEEVLSANEELQSTNEELETSKEELQSTNEELSTVNDELHLRNLDLNHLNNDLENLMNSIRIPVVMLDGALRIRRFTSSAEALLQVRLSDIGRPVSDIRLNVQVPNLESLILKVIDTLHASEHEVQDAKDHWYSLHIRPYRTADNRIDGAVLALLDIDLIKKSNEQLQQSSEFFKGIINTVREPLLVLDSDLRVISANESFLKAFQVTPQETVHKFLYRLGNEQWNIPRLRALLEEVLPTSQEVKDYEVVWDFPTIGNKTMLLNAKQLFQTNKQEPLILLAIEDITGRKGAE